MQDSSQIVCSGIIILNLSSALPLTDNQTVSVVLLHVVTSHNMKRQYKDQEHSVLEPTYFFFKSSFYHLLDLLIYFWVLHP